MIDPDEEWNAREYQDRIAELEREREQAKELADKYKWQVRDTCTRAEIAERERDALVLSTGEHVTKRSEYLARTEAAERERDELREALIKARQFIENGIELGFINLPEDKGDPSHDTLPAIRAALEAKP